MTNRGKFMTKITTVVKMHSRLMSSSSTFQAQDAGLILQAHGAGMYMDPLSVHCSQWGVFYPCSLIYS